MLQTPVLTEQNLKDYERDGFVIVRNAFNAADAAKIKQWTVELVELPEESGKTITYKVTNQGKSFRPGSILTKTLDQLAPLGE